jgi:hypothetical protein
MHPLLAEWDEKYIREIAAPGESADLEKKSAALLDPVGDKKATKEELAKQVCAFANSGPGFLVYGAVDTGGLDAGVLDLVDRQPIKAWVEAIIPTLLYPPINNCEAKFIQVPGHHAADRGVVVVAIPLSDHRPHWVSGGKEEAYIRAGEHSFPMKRQTFLDISSHGAISHGVIETLNVLSGPQLAADADQLFLLNPKVYLESGPVCELWSFELCVPRKRGRFVGQVPANARRFEDHEIRFQGEEPLFPRKLTQVGVSNFQLLLAPGITPDLEITAVLCMGSNLPIVRKFSAALDVLEPALKLQ